MKYDKGFTIEWTRLQVSDEHSERKTRIYGLASWRLLDDGLVGDMPFEFS